MKAADALKTPGDPVSRAAPALTPEIDELLAQYPLRELVTRGEQYGVWVDRPLARFRSCTGIRTTNAVTTQDGKALLITESEAGTILRAVLP